MVQCFLQYIAHDGLRISRAMLEANLLNKLQDPAFLKDVRPLLAVDAGWDPFAASEYVLRRLVPLLPGRPLKKK